MKDFLVRKKPYRVRLNGVSGAMVVTINQLTDLRPGDELLQYRREDGSVLLRKIDGKGGKGVK